MFNSDIERKIIDFIKKSPIGVTSSELAKYLHINRMTLSKYLEIIKEKTLIDFKQLGMAKLWYIPVNMNKDIFLTQMINELALNIDKNQLKKTMNKVGFKLGTQIEQLYKDFYKVDKLNLSQLTEALVDVGNKIGGEFSVVEKTDEKIILKNTKCPFGNDKVKECPELCKITSNIFGVIASKNFKYTKVCLKKTLAKEDEDQIIIFLKKTKESEQEKAADFVAAG